jgi:RHS repeat-associated protein
VTLPSGTQISYVVDGQNRRVGKKVNGTLTQGFLYQDGLRPIAQLDGSNNVISRFVYTQLGGAPAYLIKGGNTYRVIADQVGSPRLVVDVATGAIAERLDYDEFGNVVLDTSPGFQPFGFAGGLYDRDTGLVHFGARDYDPATGRWTTKDLVGFRGGDANLYGYVLEDPVNHVDVRGMGLDTLSAWLLTHPTEAAILALELGEGGVIVAENEPALAEAAPAVGEALPAAVEECPALANTIEAVSPFANTAIANTVQGVSPYANTVFSAPTVESEAGVAVDAAEAGVATDAALGAEAWWTEFEQEVARRYVARNFGRWALRAYGDLWTFLGI